MSSENRDLPSLHVKWRWPVFPWFVLGVSLMGTALATAGARKISFDKDRERFTNAVQTASDRIHDRIHAYVGILRSAGALFDAKQAAITKAEFQAFVSRLRISEDYPGFHGLGVVARTPAQQLPAFEQQMNNLGVTRLDRTNPDTVLPFSVRPVELTRDEYHPIVYLEPLHRRNHSAIGFDMFTEQVRREAMMRARDTGEAATSGRVTLVQEIEGNVQPGFLIYLPLYRSGGIPETVEERRRALLAFAYAPFRADDMFMGIFGSERYPRLHFSVYDANEPRSDSLLHSSDVGEPGDSTYQPRFRTIQQLAVPGRTWTVTFATRPEFELGSSAGFVPLTALAGVLMSALLFIASFKQYRSRLLAEQTAADLRRSEAALRFSEGRLRRLIEANLVGVVFCDTHGRISEANDAFLKLLGYKPQDLTNESLSWERLTPADDRPADERALDELEYHGVCTPYEKQLLRKDGAPVPVLVALAVLERGSDECVALVVDITERKKAEQERLELLGREQDARREAERANRLKDEFLATVSHELRTPLNAILGWAQLLTMGTPDTETLEQGLATIQRNARVQAQLVEDLLDVSRIITGKLRLDIRAVDMAAVVSAAIETVRHAADAKNILLQSELDAKLPAISGDPARLQQVAWNLLSNAIKFTPASGLVRIALRSLNGTVELQVSDTGQGIDADFLPHVFAAFRQADATTTRRHGGLGLGLAIVRHLVELHGGIVSAESDGPGRGARFTVRLPIRAAASEPHESQTPAALPDAEPLNASLRGLRVLVVDDEADARDIIGRMLEKCQATVTRVSSTPEALESLRDLQPDVLVSDISMPGEDGYDLIRRIRAMPASEGGKVPAIALTALARNEDRRRALMAGYQVHLPKPVEAEELTAVVANLVRRNGLTAS